MAENKIPVFTVTKNGAILKNIFLINKPQTPLSTSNLQSTTSTKNEANPDQESLMVGRHPDCHIMLTHPSISRFHLQIHTNRSSQKLSVIDLSSVHGTWVSGKKVEPQVPMELNEGDAIRVGTSSRLYRLHWVPFSQAFDRDNPFVSPLDVSAVVEEENEMDTLQDEISVPAPRKAIQSEDLFLREVLPEIIDKEERQTQQSLFVTSGSSEQENSESSPIRSDKSPTLHSIWSRRGKPDGILQIQAGKSKGKITGDHNSCEAELQKQENIENISISKSLFSGLEERDEENFTPNKENISPNARLVKSFKGRGKIEEVKHSRPCPSIQLEEENHTPQVSQEQKLVRNTSTKQGKMEQETPLPLSSADKIISEVSVSNTTTRSSNSVNFTRTTEESVANSLSVLEGMRRWTMVVDTSTLLDKESMKSLQLLQGLKDTQLIIPRSVTRKLDFFRQRSLFRRTTRVSSVLEWIKESMVKMKWWIHTQSSEEEGMQIAPTPRASAQSQFSEGSGTFHTSLTEIVTPMAEDNILEYALLLRKMESNGQLVLLSNDVTMKIKAMAEGLICETAQEFHESLVNPFSERFLWADSSPRGLTWSCLDDVVLREKYSRRCPVKKSSKGLKLILLKNSHHKKLSSVR